MSTYYVTVQDAFTAAGYVLVSCGHRDVSSRAYEGGVCCGCGGGYDDIAVVDNNNSNNNKNKSNNIERCCLMI